MQKKQPTWLALALAGATLAAAPGAAHAEKVTIKLGTLAPEGTEWHTTLLRMGQRWAEASGKTVELKVFPGGVVGDEGDMVRKIRIGQLHAASITGLGLGQINRATVALQVPMLMQSWEELDYVRDKLSPELEKELADAGYVVLHWADAGWVHFFSNVPAVTPADFKKLKLFVWSGDPASEDAWRTAKFNPVPLASTEGMSALKSGMVDAFQAAPIFALGTQWYAHAKHMVKVNWTPLNGATIVSKKQWEKIPPDVRTKLLEIAKDEGLKIRGIIRKMSDDAIKTMSDRGVKVATPDAAAVKAWQATANDAYPAIRGKVVPEKYFDTVEKLAKEYRAGKR